MVVGRHRKGRSLLPIILLSKKIVRKLCFMILELGELVDHLLALSSGKRYMVAVFVSVKCILGILHDSSCASWGSLSVGEGFEMCSLCLMWLIWGELD